MPGAQKKAAIIQIRPTNPGIFKPLPRKSLQKDTKLSMQHTKVWILLIYFYCPGLSARNVL